MYDAFNLWPRGREKVWLLSTGGTVICNKSSVIIGVLGKVYRDTHDINRTTSKTKKKAKKLSFSVHINLVFSEVMDFWKLHNKLTIAGNLKNKKEP